MAEFKANKSKTGYRELSPFYSGYALTLIVLSILRNEVIRDLAIEHLSGTHNWILKPYLRAYVYLFKDISPYIYIPYSRMEYLILFYPIVGFILCWFMYPRFKTKEEFSKHLEISHNYRITKIVFGIHLIAFLIGIFLQAPWFSIIYTVTTSAAIVMVYIVLKTFFSPINTKTNTKKKDPLVKRFKHYEGSLYNEPSTDEHVVSIPTFDQKYLRFNNMFRGILGVMITGSGKTETMLKPFIKHFVTKGYALFNYDIKFPELTTYAWNRYKENPIEGDRRTFKVIYPKDLRYTHKVNIMDIRYQTTHAFAQEAISTIIFAINSKWKEDTGNFFTTSVVTLYKGIAVYLHDDQKINENHINTISHIMSFATSEIDMVLNILKDNENSHKLIKPVLPGADMGAMEQLAGQWATAATALSSIAIDDIIYILSGDEINLDVNNIDNPVLLNLGNHYSLQKVYSSVMSLIATTVKRLVIGPKKTKVGFLIDEFYTLFVDGLAGLANLGRSAGVAVLGLLQSLEQLKAIYSQNDADVLKTSFANIVFGQIKDERTINFALKYMGKRHKEKTDFSVNTDSGGLTYNQRNDEQEVLDHELISSLPPGVVFGTLSDLSGDEMMDEKNYHSTSFFTRLQITNDHDPHKLPYFNQELVEAFNKQIDYHTNHAHRDYQTLVTYFRKGTTTRKERREYELLKRHYTIDDEFIGLCLSGVNSFENEEFDSKESRTNTLKKYTALLKKHINNDIESCPYLFYILHERYFEKEEQAIMEEVKNQNTRRIQNETLDFILDRNLEIFFKKYIKFRFFTSFKALFLVIQSELFALETKRNSEIGGKETFSNSVDVQSFDRNKLLTLTDYNVETNKLNVSESTIDEYVTLAGIILGLKKEQQLQLTKQEYEVLFFENLSKNDLNAILEPGRTQYDQIAADYNLEPQKRFKKLEKTLQKAYDDTPVITFLLQYPCFTSFLLGIFKEFEAPEETETAGSTKISL